MRWTWFALVSVLITSFPTTRLLGADEDSIRDIGSRLELFVDHYLIGRMEGAGLKLHEPRQAEIAINMEGYGGYTIVIKDDRTYRMYYSSRSTQDTELDTYVTRYAESTDGIHWTKPELGLFDVKGTRANNVVEKQYLVSGGFSPFLDSRPGVPASERYKALGGIFAQSPKYPGLGGLMAFVSADGIHWKQLRDKPVINKWHYPHFTDTDLPAVFWSESEGQYVCYPRVRMKNRTEFAHEDVFKTGYRWIGRTTSKDFINWTKVVPMEYAPVEEFYHNQTHPYFRAPHIYIALPTRFMGVPLNPGRHALNESQVKELLADPNNQGKFYESLLAVDIVDTVLLTSRGGNRYDRTFSEAFIRPGLDVRNWTNRANYSVLGVVPTGPNEMSIYMLHYPHFRTSHIRRYTLRTDGFVSVNAPYAGGEMVTKPFIFSGKELVINYATSAPGGVRVEIRDKAGQPLPGYSLTDATEMIGDQIERVVTWKGGSDLSKLAGKPIRLRFVMKDADLYSIRFR
jgi:hypothetical protein